MCFPCFPESLSCDRSSDRHRLAQESDRSRTGTSFPPNLACPRSGLSIKDRHRLAQKPLPVPDRPVPDRKTNKKQTRTGSVRSGLSIWDRHVFTHQSLPVLNHRALNHRACNLVGNSVRTGKDTSSCRCLSFDSIRSGDPSRTGNFVVIIDSQSWGQARTKLGTGKEMGAEQCLSPMGYPMGYPMAIPNGISQSRTGVGRSLNRCLSRIGVPDRCQRKRWGGGNRGNGVSGVFWGCWGCVGQGGKVDSGQILVFGRWAENMFPIFSI